jgi:hypothetical protein
MSKVKHGIKTKRVKKEKAVISTISLEFPVSDTFEALEQDYKDIGYPDAEAERAAKNTFAYDDI